MSLIYTLAAQRLNPTTTEPLNTEHYTVAGGDGEEKARRGGRCGQCGGWAH